jgi:hypothetical protein
MGLGRSVSREEWAIRFEEVHGKGHYDYSRLPFYPKILEKYPVRCIKHDLIFNVTPNNHFYYKRGCPKCGNEKHSETKSKNLVSRREFLEWAQVKNGLGFEYINLPVEFSVYDTIGIFCSAHNKLFFCTVGEHFGGRGCPECEAEKQRDKLDR